MIRDRTVELRRIRAGDIRPHPDNARRHNEAQRQALDAAMAEIGFAGALVVIESEGGYLLLDGHLRLTDMDADERVPAVVLDLSDDEARLFLASYDAIGGMAEYDPVALSRLMAGLNAPPALDALLQSLLSGAQEPETAKEVPEPRPEEAARLATDYGVEVGQTWQLGRHALYCGDAFGEGGKALVRGGVDMCFTDPPWNVAIGGDGSPRHRQRKGLQNDRLSAKEFAASVLHPMAMQLAATVKGDAYIVMGMENYALLDGAMRAERFHWSSTLMWVKDVFVFGQSKYHRRYEPIWYGWHSSRKSSYRGGRKQDDVWEIARPKRSEEYPTMKPPALVERAIANSSVAGATVYDPFVGSGTTLCAAEATERKCLAADISPEFVAVTVRRWEEMTGEKAVVVA